MKTLWIFLNSQILAWCIGLTVVYRIPSATYPDSFYWMAGACTVGGIYAFMKLNPRVSDLDKNERLIVVCIFLAGLLYIPYIVQLLQTRFSI